MTWKRDLGRQIRDARKSSSLTQAELAQRLHVSRQMISRYESGTDAPSVEVLALAATILSVEFQVQGIRILSSDSEASHKLKALPKQLAFGFGKAHRFRDAVIEITPNEGQIMIKAVIPA